MHANIPVIVTRIIQETETVKRFTLTAKSKELLPAFSSGSHITTFLPTQTGMLERHYSLLNDPGEMLSSYDIAVQKSADSRGGSLYLHTAVDVGSELSISYPKNHFLPSFRARHHVFIAAGIGITPFLSMMAELSRAGKTFELHYAAKSREQCAFYAQLQRLYPDSCRFYFSADGPAARLQPVVMASQPIGTHVYFCGPEMMVSQFRAAAQGYGYPDKSVHFELFTPITPITRSPFVAELRKSNKSIEVGEQQSLLDALLQAGIRAPYSCRVGGCGTCAVEVLDGTVAHYDTVLTDSERAQHNQMMTCVSRAACEKLVLNL
ncbi:PDR/VanB family oxidoreductase [Brevibacillus fluminis]|uniref:PDR/VanB family oxidoreductase n=1 Tax=Brevibacillus fluminis TaxID=511487 RepID=UPI003F8CF227